MKDDSGDIWKCSVENIDDSNRVRHTDKLILKQRGRSAFGFRCGADKQQNRKSKGG